MTIYQKQSLQKRNLFQKLFRINPKKNALVALNNLFAAYENEVQSITENQIRAIEANYKVNFRKHFVTDRTNLYHKYLRYCLSDADVSAMETDDLSHLRHLLLLNEEQVSAVFQVEAQKIFEKQANEVLKDNIYNTTEEEKLSALQQKLLLPLELTQKIFREIAANHLQKMLEKSVQDQRLSPDEEAELATLAKSLGLELRLDEKTRKILDKYKLFWQVENGNLPQLEAGINLQKNELLHFKISVEWRETRKITRRYNYSGPTARIRIMKGVYYRMGSLGVSRISEDVLKLIDTGTVYLTSKRLVFMGAKGNKTLRYSRILGITPFADGVEIEKDSGKNPFLSMGDHKDLFCIFLSRLLEDI